MDVSVNIKATTADLDLLRSAVDHYAEAKGAEAKDSTVGDAEGRRKARAEQAMAVELRRKL